MTALQSCYTAHPNGGGYVVLGAGTFTLSSNLFNYNQSTGAINYQNVTLRGSGANSTKITGNGVINIGETWGNGSTLLTASPAKGATSITTQTAPPTGILGLLEQCDTGFSAPNSGFTTGSSSCTGTYRDNLGIYVCDRSSTCIRSGSGGGDTNPHTQGQAVRVQSVTGAGPYTVNFAPGTTIYMPNWSTGNTASLYWQDADKYTNGIGVEDMTLQGPTVAFWGAYACWIKGVRFVTNGGTYVWTAIRSAHLLIANNYVFSTYTGPTDNELATDSSFSGEGNTSDLLYLNNILQGGFIEGNGGDEDIVFGYNYIRDAHTTYPENGEFEHEPGTAFVLREGNQYGYSQDDDTWGTKDFDTWFRNYVSCGDPPYVGSMGGVDAILVDSWARFDNLIGNALGGQPTCKSGYGGIIGVNVGGAVNDSSGLTAASLMRWGNYDTATGAVRWNTSEVPTNLSSWPNAVPFQQGFIPGTSLPATFFLTNDRTNYVTAHPSGGTGLNWWKVCTRWTTFPTSCASSQTQPFPPIGPDVTGGNNVNGYAYDIPATVAWMNLPIDTNYQGSYTVTGSSWSTGTETLTVSGLPNGIHTIGGFQFQGVPSACNPSGGELFMTASTSTTVSYALASNPNTRCTGTMKWPDVRQFDESVYQSDSAGPMPPTGLTAVAH